MLTKLNEKDEEGQTQFIGTDQEWSEHDRDEETNHEFQMDCLNQEEVIF